MALSASSQSSVRSSSMGRKGFIAVLMLASGNCLLVGLIHSTVVHRCARLNELSRSPWLRSRWRWRAVLALAGLTGRTGFTFDGDVGVGFGLVAAGAGGLVQFGDHAPDSVGQFFRTHAFAETFDH